MSRSGDGGPDRCSMGPKRSLERVIFSLKSPFLRGVQWHVLGPKWLRFLVGMVHMDRWDLGDMSDV